MAADSNSARSNAHLYISQSRFHQRFTLPATADHESLTISYADVGQATNQNSPDPHTPTILFIPGMFASRYFGIYLHAIGEKLGVRILIVDRPGMGHSTNVALHQRVSVWVELVPRLLAHLNIEHVSLVSHSNGTIYLLNTLYHCRGILHPEKPFVGLLAPWVDPVHSHVTYLQMAQYLPVKAFSVWHLIPQFFISTAVPTFAFSGAVVTKLSNSTFPGWGSTANEGTSVKAMNRRKRETDYGLSRDLQDELDTLIPKSMFEEDTVGANSEALLCLKKGGSSTWGKCEEYGLFVRELVDVERQRQGTLTSTEGRPRLKIRTYFAQTDAMIGVKGQSYVEECWRGLDGNEFIDVVDFASITVAGVDHDTLIQSVQTLEMIFAEVKGIWN